MIDIKNPQTTTFIIIIAKKIKQSFTAPLSVNEHKFHIAINIGISLYPDDGDDGMYDARLGLALTIF